jgi:hypothetical protein
MYIFVTQLPHKKLFSRTILHRSIQKNIQILQNKDSYLT